MDAYPQCHVSQGEKHIARAFKNYIIIVATEFICLTGKTIRMKFF